MTEDIRVLFPFFFFLNNTNTKVKPKSKTERAQPGDIRIHNQPGDLRILNDAVPQPFSYMIISTVQTSESLIHMIVSR